MIIRRLNIMKKLFIVCCLLLLVALCSCNTEQVNLTEYNEGTIVFVYGDKQICEMLDYTDTSKLKGIINYKVLYNDNPSCGFDDNISLRFDDKIFSIACDGCPIIKYNGKYISLSENEIILMHNIMEKYGAVFPCV